MNATADRRLSLCAKSTSRADRSRTARSSLRKVRTVVLLALMLPALAATDARAALPVAVTDGGAVISLRKQGEQLIVRDRRSVHLVLPRGAKALPVTGDPERAVAAIGPDGLRVLALVVASADETAAWRVAATTWRRGERSASLQWLSPSGRHVEAAPSVDVTLRRAAVAWTMSRPYAPAVAVRSGKRWRIRELPPTGAGSGQTLQTSVEQPRGGGLPLVVWPVGGGAVASWGGEFRRLPAGGTSRSGLHGQQLLAVDGTAVMGWLDLVTESAQLAWRRPAGPLHIVKLGRSVTGAAGFPSIAVRDGRFVMAWSDADEHVRVRMGRLGGRLSPVRRLGPIASYEWPRVIIDHRGRTHVVFSSFRLTRAVTLTPDARVVARRSVRGGQCTGPPLLASPAGRHPIAVLPCEGIRVLRLGR
jgi:hypothetical protein